MGFIKRVVLLGVSSVGCLLATSTTAAAFSLGFDVESEGYNVAFSKQTFDESLVTFTDYDSAYTAAEVLAAALDDNVQELSKADGFKGGFDFFFVPFGVKTNSNGTQRARVIKIKEKRDGTDILFEGENRVPLDRNVIYADFQRAPEPLTILGSIAAVGIGVAIKRKHQAS